MFKTIAMGCALAALVGCVEEDHYLPGRDQDPVPRQVLITSAPGDDAVSGLTLAYGQHPDVNGGAEALGVRASAVPRTGASFRVVVSELLEGETLEEFACAGGGFTRTPELRRCPGCPDDLSTAEDETDRCIDVQGDGIPDVVRLLDGIATIRCGGFLYTTLPGDGFYFPSGNQFTTTSFGLAGLGPAIVIEPLVTLPADADCTFNLIARIEDKDGEALVWPASGVPFHTAP